MRRRPSSPTSGSRSQSGYTLAEVLVALAVGSTVAIAATSGYVFATRGWQDQRQRLDTQQNLRRAVDMLSREVRLAGACLPDAGPADGSIRPLDGADSDAADTITVRANVRCAIGTLQSPANAGATSLNLDTVANFVAGMQAYILSSDTTYGEFVLVGSVNEPASRLVLGTPITNPLGYPRGSTVYGAESQTYAIDSSGAVPILTVTPSLGTAQPAVAGIERLNVRYVLDRPYTGGCVANADGFCVVELPAGAEWSSVRAVQLDLGARSAVPLAGGFYRLGQVIQVKPRNLLF